MKEILTQSHLASRRRVKDSRPSRPIRNTNEKSKSCFGPPWYLTYKALYIPNQVLRISNHHTTHKFIILASFYHQFKATVSVLYNDDNSGTLRPYLGLLFSIWYASLSTSDMHQHWLIALSLAIFISLWISNEQGIDRGLELDFIHILFIMIFIYNCHHDNTC